MTSHPNLRGLKSLVHDAVDATVDLVRDGHESVSRTISTVGDAAGVGGPVRAVESTRMAATNGILQTITTVNRAVEHATDRLIDSADSGDDNDASAVALPLRDDIAWGKTWWTDVFVGGVNGAVGDHLARRKNPLDAPMVLRADDRYHDLNACEVGALGSPKHVAIFVHGLATTEWSWVFGSEQAWGDPTTCFGTLLREQVGLTPMWLRYNTGRTIEENGAAFSRLLAQLHRVCPGLKRVDIIGHSMGGLVTREACRIGVVEDACWLPLIGELFYLGSPHTGAPLARFARGVSGVLGAVDLPATRIISAVIDGRSAGIKDLADGLSAPLPAPHARHTFIAGTVTNSAEHPVGWVLGDLLVRRASAEGEGVVEQTVQVRREHRGSVAHHQLQNHPAVFEVLRRVYAGELEGEPDPAEH